MTKNNYEAMTATELKNQAKERKVKNWWNLKKAELVEALSTLDKVEEAEKATKEVETEPNGEKTPKKDPAEKVEKNGENIITLKEIAMEYGIKGSKARRLLREADIERPYKRWEWDQEEHHSIVTEVKAILGGGQEE